MKKLNLLKSKIIDFATHDIDLKSPRTKKALIILGFNEKDIIRKYI